MDTVLLPADILYTSEKSESYNTIERGDFMMRFLPDVFTDTFEDMEGSVLVKSNSCMKTDVRELDR